MHSHDPQAAITNLIKWGMDHLRIYDRNFSLNFKHTQLLHLYHQIEVCLLYQSFEADQ
jgi:hypothetical protein